MDVQIAESQVLVEGVAGDGSIEDSIGKRAIDGSRSLQLRFASRVIRGSSQEIEQGYELSFQRPLLGYLRLEYGISVSRHSWLSSESDDIVNLGSRAFRLTPELEGRGMMRPVSLRFEKIDGGFKLLGAVDLAEPYRVSAHCDEGADRGCDIGSRHDSLMGWLGEKAQVSEHRIPHVLANSADSFVRIEMQEMDIALAGSSHGGVG